MKIIFLMTNSFFAFAELWLSFPACRSCVAQSVWIQKWRYVWRWLLWRWPDDDGQLHDSIRRPATAVWTGCRRKWWTTIRGSEGTDVRWTPLVLFSREDWIIDALALSKLPRGLFLFRGDSEGSRDDEAASLSLKRAHSTEHPKKGKRKSLTTENAAKNFNCKIIKPDCKFHKNAQNSFYANLSTFSIKNVITL